MKTLELVYYSTLGSRIIKKKKCPAPWSVTRICLMLQDSRLRGFTAKSKVVVQSTLHTPRPNRFTRALPPRGSRDPLRVAEGGALPYEGARHCPGFSLPARSPPRGPSPESA